MFENAGGKIKKSAMVFFWLGVIGCIVLAFVAWDNWWIDTFPIILCFIAAVVICYVESLIIYGFGQLVEDTQQIREAAGKEKVVVAKQMSKSEDVLPDL